MDDGGLSNQLDQQFMETRTVLVFGELTPALVQRVSQQVLLLAARSAAAMRLLINAQGGTVASGEALLDVLRGVGAPVKVIGTGAVANAAALAYLAPPRAQRYCLPHARFSLYQSYSAPGGDVLAAAALVAQQRARVAALIARQTGQPEELVERDLERAYWLEAAEARQYGIVGQVIEGLDEVG
jgi:ATP-dependent Clp protease, protease subunit